MTQLFEIIRCEVVQRGVLPFARFMELALYCPKHGYYEMKKDNPGRRGDFYTSAGVGEVFGQLLACQFAEWLEPLRIADCGLRIVEAGAHDGKLAGDILGWLRLKRPELCGQIEYWIIEPSAVRQEWQRETLREFAPSVRWFAGFQSLREDRSCHPAPVPRQASVRGIIFSNELLDAMPVQRFGWDAAKQAWFEWGVAVEGDKFVWAKMPVPDLRSPISDLPSSPELLAVLPDGYTIELCPAAENWWREAASVLDSGRLMTIDYGLTAGELLSPARSRGTLRAYFHHHAGDDVLANVGEQDLTAHVNFSAIQSAGESAGLKTERLRTQSQFLVEILAKAGTSLGEWTPARARQLQTLTHPEHLGRAFRVLVQSR